MGIALFFFFLVLVLPAVSGITGGYIDTPAAALSSPAGPVVQLVETGTAVTTSPSAAVIIRPTPLPTRQNRSTIIQIAKNAADKQKVTIPAFWFLLIVAIAIIGLIAILYFLIRRGAGAFPVGKTPPAKGGGTSTVVEAPVPETNSEPESRGPVIPAVEFPLSLKKRFTNPAFIGEGGLARVFRAQNAKTGMTVAVKVPVRFDEVTGTHFTRDIVFWQSLEHTNIVQVYSSNILPVPYIEMEYAPSSLAAVPLPVPEEKAVGLVLGIARGLAYAHKKGIVHRDIKPENILLSANGTPKITDWGLGKSMGDSRQSTLIGFSPAYAAPEQIAPHRFGRQGPATDVYQIGILLCELLTGRPVYSGEGIHDLNMAILEASPQIPSWGGLHETELRAVIWRCLKKQPDERYHSVDAMIRDLEALQGK